VDVEHTVITKMFEEKVNSLLKGSVEKQSTKKKMIIFNGSISKFFCIKDSFKREDVPHKECLEELGLLIVNNNLPI
jgi:hypothetical protein